MRRATSPERRAAVKLQQLFPDASLTSGKPRASGERASSFTGGHKGRDTRSPSGSALANALYTKGGAGTAGDATDAARSELAKLWRAQGQAAGAAAAANDNLTSFDSAAEKFASSNMLWHGELLGGKAADVSLSVLRNDLDRRVSNPQGSDVLSLGAQTLSSAQASFPVNSSDFSFPSNIAASAGDSDDSNNSLEVMNAALCAVKSISFRSRNAAANRELVRSLGSRDTKG